MSDYLSLETSHEVFAVIRAKHYQDLKVFSSYSAPNGDEFGNPNEGVMFTEYGFENACSPTIGAETRWDIDREKPHNRKNERSKYWLCLPVEEL